MFAHEVKGRDRPIDWIAKDGKVSGGLRQDLMQAEEHMSFENAKAFQLLRRKTPQMTARPFRENRIDRKDLEERIFALDETIEGRPRALGDVQKDQCLAVHRSRP